MGGVSLIREEVLTHAKCGFGCVAVSLGIVNLEPRNAAAGEVCTILALIRDAQEFMNVSTWLVWSGIVGIYVGT